MNLFHLTFSSYYYNNNNIIIITIFHMFNKNVFEHQPSEKCNIFKKFYNRYLRISMLNYVLKIFIFIGKCAWTIVGDWDKLFLSEIN